MLSKTSQERGLIMAKVRNIGNVLKSNRVKKCTSIGNSVRTKIKNKHKRRMFKKYRGQGK